MSISPHLLNSLRQVAIAGVLATSATVLLSVALTPAANMTVRVALAVFCTLAVINPSTALLITAAFLGFGQILATIAGVPTLRTTEVLAVASLAGFAVRALPRGSRFQVGPPAALTVPTVLLTVAVVSSAAVWMRVYQVETRYASTFVRDLLDELSHHYFTSFADFWELVSTATLLESLALSIAIAAMCRADSSFFQRGLRMLAIGGFGLGLLSVYRVIEISLRSPGMIAALRQSQGGLRISPQIPDLIAAGSYLCICWLIFIALALAEPRRRGLWLILSVPVLIGLYLTGSRSVVAAAGVGIAVLLILLLKHRRTAVRRAVVISAVAVTLMIVAYPWVTGRDIAGKLAGHSLTVRTELVKTSLRVMATRPIFGVGLDRYHLTAGFKSSPELEALYPGRKNPHNDFLRIGAELGLLGLACLAGILVVAGRCIWRRLTITADVRLSGLVAGLAAFLTTSLVSDPLSLREVSYAFWIALGLAVGRSTLADAGETPVRTAGAATGRWRPWQVAVTAAIAGSILASIPFRAQLELKNVNLAGVSYGLSQWRMTEDGHEARRSGPRFTLFVDERALAVEVSVRSTMPAGRAQQVEVRLGGRLANRVTVGRDWMALRVVLPRYPSGGTRRLDFRVHPSWVPAEEVPGHHETRELGVEVGDVSIVTAASSERPR